MSQAVLEEKRLKELFKEALLELLQERSDLLRELVLEAIEDIAMVRAIQEGEGTAVAEREEVYRILEGGLEDRVQEELREGPGEGER